MKFICLLLFAAAALPSMGAVVTEMLPSGRLFQGDLADPREIRMALAFQGDGRLNAAIGNYFSIVGFQEPKEWSVHLGLEGAGYFTMREADNRFPLETTDGLIGVYADGKLGDAWLGQLRYTHVSAHLADGSSGSAIPYSRETLSFRGAWAPSPSFETYVGIHYLTHAIPEVTPLQFQGGMMAYWLKSHRFFPFLGADLKWRRESSYDPSFSLQLGVAMGSPEVAYRSFRVFYSYYTGADPRGQYYDRPLTVHALGLEMQI